MSIGTSQALSAVWCLSRMLSSDVRIGLLQRRPPEGSTRGRRSLKGITRLTRSRSHSLQIWIRAPLMTTRSCLPMVAELLHTCNMSSLEYGSLVCRSCALHVRWDATVASGRRRQAPGHMCYSHDGCQPKCYPAEYLTGYRS